MLKKAALVSLGVALLVLYVILTPLPNTQTENTPPASTQPPAPPASTQPPDQPAVGQTVVDTETPHTVETTPTQPGLEVEKPRALPKLEVSILAPEVVNVTTLPTEVRYQTVVRNIGNGTATVDIDGVFYRVEPGGEVAINSSIKIHHAGLYTVVVYVNNTLYKKDVYVYYYTYILIAEPVRVNVTKIPTEVTISIKIRNIGNMTGRAGGVEIPPGGEARVEMSLNVVSVGRHVVKLDDVEVSVDVYYHTPAFEWRVGGLDEVEALPGEKYSAWLWLKNIGNDTANLNINGRRVVLAPQEAVNITSTLEIRRAGVHRYVFEISGDLNIEVVHEMRVKIVHISVEIFIQSPEIRRAWPRPNSTDGTSITVSTKNVELKWGYSIYTNATRRSITLVVIDPGGSYTQRLGPGQVLTRNLTETAEAPGSTTLWLKINSTTYGFTTVLTLTSPKISVSRIHRVELVDSRRLHSVRIRCRYGGVPVPISFDVVEVRAVVEYGADVRTVSGTAVVYSPQGVQNIRFEGRTEGARGWATLKVSSLEVYVEFNTQPLKITKILVNREYVDCSVPIELLPSLLYREAPTTSGEEDAVQYIFRLFSALARESGERPQSIVWNGEFFEIVDGRGRRHNVYVESGRIIIQGDLKATVVIT